MTAKTKLSSGERAALEMIRSQPKDPWSPHSDILRSLVSMGLVECVPRLTEAGWKALEGKPEEKKT